MGIKIIGLGAGDINQLPLGIYRYLLTTENVIYSRTNEHPVIQDLILEGVEFQSFDYFYTEQEQFADVYTNIASKLLEEGHADEITYVVPGHPLVAEQTVQMLLDQNEVSVEIEGGKSFLDDLFTTLKIDPIEGFQLIDATKFTRDDLNYQQHLIFAQVYDAYVASEVKLELLEDLNPDYEIYIVKAVGSQNEKIIKVPSHLLDHNIQLDNLVSVYVPPIRPPLRHTFSDLKKTIATLRGPNGCEWDKKQTHQSLRKYVIEEVYELVEAINNNDDENMIEELGDVLLQDMMHSQIGEDESYFTIDDVIEQINNKMIRRHPHDNSDVVVEAVREKNQNGEAIKNKETKNKKEESVLENIPKSLPTLQKTMKIIKKAKQSGFDWQHINQLWEKLDEELTEFKEAIQQRNQNEIELEYGDVLFVLADLADNYQLNPEFALMKVNEKFVSRFQAVEQGAKPLNKTVLDLTEDEKEMFWERAKERE